MNMGQWGAGIGVPVQCCMECNIPPCYAHVPALFSVVIKASYQCIVESV